MSVSQSRAAELLGITTSAYQMLERGERWAGGKATTIDLRTELACLWLLARYRGLVTAAQERRLAKAFEGDGHNI